MRLIALRITDDPLSSHQLIVCFTWNHGC